MAPPLRHHSDTGCDTGCEAAIPLPPNPEHHGEVVVRGADEVNGGRAESRWKSRYTGRGGDQLRTAARGMRRHREHRFRTPRTRDRHQGPRSTPRPPRQGQQVRRRLQRRRPSRPGPQRPGQEPRRRPRRRRGHRDRLRNRSRNGSRSHTWTRSRCTAVAEPGAPSSPYEGPVTRRLRRGGELRPGQGRLHRSRRVDGPAVRRAGPAPVPLQILFGSPAGLTGRAVELVIPAAARAGNDWPDQPVCGDFDGDGAEDLVVHASDGRLSYLRGPFTRKGAPARRADPSPHPAPCPPAPPST